MGTTNRRAAGTGAARVQGLNVPDWLRPEADEKNKDIPKHAVTAVMYAKIIGRQRARAQQILLRRFEAGLVERAHDGTRHWYWPKEKQ